MNLVNELTLLAALASSMYVVGAAICRLRHGSLAKPWATLYVAVLGNALWTASDLMRGHATLRDATIVIVVAAYIYLTQKSWVAGVPVIAKKQRNNSV